MPASAAFYTGVVSVVVGVALAAGGFFWPAGESRVAVPVTRLDEVMPVWQFREFHSRRIDAPPAEVFAALRQVRADEILFFRTLTWIRRGGRALPPSILNAGTDRPLIDVALSSGFVQLAEEPGRELVIGTLVGIPAGADRTRTASLVRHPPPGYSAGVMNFRVVPDGSGTRVSTETRVFSNGPVAKRRFARYWRVIYPGSALIRRMWLRAIERRCPGLSPP